jgi:hypothetical protein
MMMMTKGNTAREPHNLWQAFCGVSTPTDARNNRRLGIATLIWLSCFPAALIVMERYVDIINPAMVMTVAFMTTIVVLHRWYSR